MSVKNRKNTYDKLVAAERFDDICDALKEEFGDPKDPNKKDDGGKKTWAEKLFKR